MALKLSSSEQTIITGKFQTSKCKHVFNIKWCAESMEEFRPAYRTGTINRIIFYDVEVVNISWSFRYTICLPSLLQPSLLLENLWLHANTTHSENFIPTCFIFRFVIFRRGLEIYWFSAFTAKRSQCVSKEWSGKFEKHFDCSSNNKFCTCPPKLVWNFSNSKPFPLDYGFYPFNSHMLLKAWVLMTKNSNPTCWTTWVDVWRPNRSHCEDCFALPKSI